MWIVSHEWFIGAGGGYRTHFAHNGKSFTDSLADLCHTGMISQSSLEITVTFCIYVIFGTIHRSPSLWLFGIFLTGLSSSQFSLCSKSPSVLHVCNQFFVPIWGWTWAWHNNHLLSKGGQLTSITILHHGESFSIAWIYLFSLSMQYSGILHSIASTGWFYNNSVGQWLCIHQGWVIANPLPKAPPPGLEPGTFWLTARCSAIELWRNKNFFLVWIPS